MRTDSAILADAGLMEDERGAVVLKEDKYSDSGVSFSGWNWQLATIELLLDIRALLTGRVNSKRGEEVRD